MPASASRRSATHRARRIATLGATVGASLLATGVVQPSVAAASETPESAYLSAINQERTAHGLRPLVERHSLHVVADSWAAHMADSGTLAHNPALASSVTNWQALGENVGVGPDIDSLDRAFWNSDAHRANILDPSYSDVGIGAVTRDGTIWITIDFRDPMHAVPVHTTTVRHKARHAATPHGSSRRPEHWSTPGRQQRHQGHQHRVLRVGSQGRDVARVQRRLQVAADGIFGPITRAAVQGFQRRHNHRPTGVVGPRTWRAITR